MNCAIGTSSPLELAKFKRDLIAEGLRGVLDEIVVMLNRFVVLPESAAEAVALYILQTHLVDLAEFAPMLVVTSPEMRCGKSTLLTLLAELVREPSAAANASAAALFRVIEATKPTLLLDEVDAILGQKSETTEAIRGILNAGHRRGRFSCVLRVEGEKFDVKRFSVFGFKILSGIGNVPATWKDRSILIPLRRKSPDEKVESLRIHRLQGELDALREKIALAVAEAVPFIEMYFDPVFPDGLNDRARDNWELALHLADFAGGTWPEKARAAAVVFSGKDDAGTSPGTMLLADIRDFLAEDPRDVFGTESLIHYLKEREDRPWSTWNRGETIGAPQIAKMLRGYDIRPEKLSIQGEKKRGYRSSMFAEAFERYLSSDSVNSNQNKELNSLPVEPEVEEDGSGTGEKRYSEPRRYHDNSLFDNEIVDNGTGVPGKTGGGTAPEEALSPSAEEAGEVEPVFY